MVVVSDGDAPPPPLLSPQPSTSPNTSAVGLYNVCDVRQKRRQKKHRCPVLRTQRHFRLLTMTIVEAGLLSFLLLLFRTTGTRCLCGRTARSTVPPRMNRERRDDCQERRRTVLAAGSPEARRAELYRTEVVLRQVARRPTSRHRAV